MFLYSVLSVSYLLISIDVTDIFGLCILVGLRAILKLDYRALGIESIATTRYTGIGTVSLPASCRCVSVKPWFHDRIKH